MKDEWLKFKRYPHIGQPLTTKKDMAWVREYVQNHKNIANHKFVPLLHRNLIQRKYRPQENAIRSATGKRLRIAGEKVRHIYFPSHLDSIIYSYYNHLLTSAYEDYLKDKAYASVAVAYRKIPIEERQKGNKSNIEFAFEAFEFIENNKDRKLSIIVADVTSFFDNLDHRLLHKQWKLVLGTDNLSEAHYNVYKSLVDYKYVNENELFKRFQNRLIVERFKPNDITQQEYKRKRVGRIYNMRQENVVAFCSKEEFFEEAIDLIRLDKPYNSAIRVSLGKDAKKGIPQGTPISATLANIYMLDFDERVYTEVSSPEKNAYYQRYSDDLIIICDQSDEGYFYKLIQEEIETKANLNIQPTKTHIYRYELNEDFEFKGGIIENGLVNPNKQLEYLGFKYDGLKVRVKTAGFSKFYRAMKRSFRRGAHFAKQAHVPSDSLYQTRLYKRFTHLGSKRRLKWLPDINSETGYSRSTQQDWGNFISYLNKANSVMRRINNDDAIANQYRKVWGKFHEVKKLTNKEIAVSIQKRNSKVNK